MVWEKRERLSGGGDLTDTMSLTWVAQKGLQRGWSGSREAHEKLRVQARDDGSLGQRW